MDSLKYRIGYYSSLINLLSTITFGVCFFTLFLVNPIFEWTSLDAYVEYCKSYNQSLKYIAQSTMIVLSITLVIIIALIDDFTNSHNKFFSKLSLAFASISTTLITLAYFIQITSVRWNFENNTTSGLEHFIQFYPDSAILAVIMLGYTLFLGISSFCILPVFSKSKKERLVKLGFTIIGYSCILGFIGFIFQIVSLILIATNIGIGLGLIILGIGLIRFFKR